MREDSPNIYTELIYANKIIGEMGEWMKKKEKVTRNSIFVDDSGEKMFSLGG